MGERGLTLSGGQKVRLSLARALYSESDLLLLDDPFSAVDAKVGMKMYEGLLKNVVGKRTVILITHQTQYITKCDFVVVLAGGEAKVVSEWAKEELIADQEEDMKEIDEVKTKEEVEKDIGFSKEENVKVGIKSYCKYLLYHKISYLLLPLSLLFLFSYQMTISFIFRLYSSYDSAK